ncbi:histidine kinase [Glycomyces sp. A-F 0318]|uniref:sensor histidine kinase n=1 Tax=Glycomyces amatae TaxID=2881355 RepID=UPI001E333F34|nr:histidine kinase [Glycomyces amatae]
MSPTRETATAPARDLRRLRRYTYGSVIGSGPLALFMGAAFLAASDMDPGALPLAAGALTASVALCTAALVLHWNGGDLWRRRALWGAALALFLLGAGVEAASTPIGDAWAAPTGLLVAEAALWARPGRRARALMVGVLAATAAAVGLALAGLMTPQAMIMTVFLLPAVAGGIVCQLWHYQVAQEIEKARGLAGELAVAQERLRFAAELHDVQGGNLTVITLKAQMARRFMEERPQLAAAEVQAIEELARETLKDMRAVVGGYRKVGLSEEIDAAARTLKSAGVAATVPDAVPSLDEDAERLLGLLVREATTNLIRHAEPTAADVSIVEVDAAVTVTVTNDGAPKPAHGAGNGLSMLAGRFGEAGGGVEHAHEDGRFTVRGTLPRAAAPARRLPLQPRRRAGRLAPVRARRSAS